MGFVRVQEGVNEDWLAAGEFAIDVAGERVPALAQLDAFYDPAGERMRG
jgi:4-methylaminobutanoate oxidase (formaldehyde-forming)